MSESPARWKTGVVTAILVWVALWPFAHRGLVAAFDIHPWRLGGFAMYATHWATLTVLFEPDGRNLAPVDPSTLSASARAALARFQQDRLNLGALREPDDVAREVFASRPDLAYLLVVIQRFFLDPETGRIASDKDQVLYDRVILEQEDQI